MPTNKELMLLCMEAMQLSWRLTWPAETNGASEKVKRIDRKALARLERRAEKLRLFEQPEAARQFAEAAQERVT